MGERDELAAVVKAEAERIEHDPDGDEWEAIPSPDDLAEAVRIVRALHYGSAVMSPEFEALVVYGDEFDRLRLVEQAATTLVEEWEAIRNPADKLVWTIAEQLTERLAAAVHGETP